MRGGDHRLVVLFFTVLLDLVGFGIVLPLLPLYARDFGADGLLTGLLVSIYSLVQLVMAPVWGRISDRIGRRPVLLLGLFGSGVAYLVFARADSLAMLFLSRIVGGIGGSTIPVAQ
ncbi:MAG: MFS transporter, partial [Gemmatimonadota bacterium]|nr:MFS transporter [Gemmatimonadota bacterium]